MLERSFARPFLAIVGVSCALALVTATSRVSADAPAVPPPPVPVGPTSPPTTVPGANAAATPLSSPLAVASASPQPRGRRGRRETTPSTPAPEPSGTPTSPAFATLDGSWEVQTQYIDHTDYSYLDIAQTASGALAGNWRINGKAYPFTGSYDGRSLNLLVTGPKGNITWAGYVEAASDIVGTVDLGDGKTTKTAFTAEHRPSAKGLFGRDKPSPAPPSSRPAPAFSQPPH